MKHKIATAIGAGLLVTILVLPFPAPVLLGTAVVIGWLLITAYGVYAIRSDWFLISRHVTAPGTVALTFDDGPDPETTPLVLAILREKQVKATFFLIGEKAASHPDLVRQIVREGHSIGNHSFGHWIGMGGYRFPKLKRDLERCSSVLEEITAVKVRLFRPPFGVTTPRYARALKQLNLESIGWSLRSYDTVIRDPEQLSGRLRKQLVSGSIVLLHDNRPITARVLADFIDCCRERKLKLVPVIPGNVSDEA